MTQDNKQTKYNNELTLTRHCKPGDLIYKELTWENSEEGVSKICFSPKLVFARKSYSLSDISITYRTFENEKFVIVIKIKIPEHMNSYNT